MPWQQHVLDVSYELDEEATELASSAAGRFQPRLWYREADLTVPRQSGKTTKAKARHTHRMRRSRDLGWAARPLSFYMAQTATDARDKLVEEWFPSFEESPFYLVDDDTGKALPDSPIQAFVRSNGREAIRWLGGGRITVKPPSRTGGHGGSPDLIDLDEAFAHRDATAEQGVRPGMITKVSPQIWVVSTAGTAESTFLWDKVDSGRARCESGQHGRVAYFEWSAPEDADPSDQQVWAACMPALGITQPLEAVQAEFEAMKLDEFRRAYLNQWTSSVARIIPAASWAECLDYSSKPAGRLFLSVDASPGAGLGRAVSIAIGGRNADGRIHGEVIDNAPGLAWAAPRIGELTRKWPEIEAVYYDPMGPVGSIAADIEEHAVCSIETVGAREMASACERYLEDVMTARAAHIGQDVLDNAVDGAARRVLLDSWAWARRRSTTDISPLVAVTLTHWAVVTHPEELGRIR